jgi:phosphate/sulfate permease
MKEVFKKIFTRKVIEPIVTFIVSVLVLQFLVFPGLTIDNTIINILSGIIGILLGMIVLTYSDGIIKEQFEKKEDKPNQEKEKTEEDGKI